MAYMSQDKKKDLAPKIKAICKKFYINATLSIRNHSTLCLNISKGAIDFLPENVNYASVNVYHIDTQYSGIAKQFLKEVHDAMNEGNHNNSDIMSDYFDIGFYTDINIGNWDKPYICTSKGCK